MAYEVKDNTGSVFQNDKKEKDTHPDRTGQAKIGGVDYWVSGWIKQDRNGKPYLSLAFKPKGQAAKPPAPAAPRKSTKDDFDDFVPF